MARALLPSLGELRALLRDQLNALTLKMYFTYINSSMKADFSKI